MLGSYEYLYTGGQWGSPLGHPGTQGLLLAINPGHPPSRWCLKKYLTHVEWFAWQWYHWHCTEGWGLLKVAHSSKNLPSPIQLKLLRSVTGTQEHTFQPNLWPFFALKGSKRLQISWARRKSRFFWKIRVFLHFSFFCQKFNFWPNHDNAFVSSCLKQHQMAKNMHF